MALHFVYTLAKVCLSSFYVLGIAELSLVSFYSFTVNTANIIIGSVTVICEFTYWKCIDY